MASHLKKTLVASLISAGLIGVGVIAVWSSATPPSAAAAPPFVEELGPDALARGPSAVVLGNPQGDVTVVEYFDYQCPVCRKVHPFVEQLVAEDSNVRVIHKHWPVFGAASIYASRVALAARWQDRYEEVHDALMGTGGRLDEDKVRQAAVSAGVDMDRLERDLDARADEIDAALGEATIQARSLQLQGTPGFVIGNYLVPGGLDLATMKEIVSDVRASRTGDQQG